MLPDQEQSNSNTLQALTTQLDAVTQSLNRQQQDVTFLQAMVAQQTHDLQNAEPTVRAAVDERRTELKTLISKAGARGTIHARPPDVVEVTRKIAELQASIARAESEPATSSAVARHQPP